MDLKSFEPISCTQIPRDENGICTADLYVFLPTPKKFIVFVSKGQRFSHTHRLTMEKHIVPALFVRAAGAPVLETGSAEMDNVYQVLGQGTTQTLSNIFKMLTAQGGTNSKEALVKLKKLADDIISVVAPDIEDIKAKMLQNAQYLWVMNDAAALTTLTIMFAAANEVISSQPLHDLAAACLVMDLPLVKMSQEHVLAYLTDPNTLPEEIRKEYENHPLHAYQLVKSQLKNFSDATCQLVMNHHELNNGTGFPRMLRTGGSFALLKVFAAAVNTFDILKRAQHLGTPITLQAALLHLSEPKAEAHNRRHNKDIIDKVLAYMAPTRVA